VYPLPENVGLTLDVDVGHRVRSVTANSPAGRAGLRPGDQLQQLNGHAVASFADAQYALHRAPAKGQIPVAWQRAGRAHTGTLELAEGWGKTKVTWRPSMLDLLPSLALYGDDLTAAEKQALGLAPKRLAFRQENIVHSTIRAAGVQGGDVVVGVDNQPLEMTMTDVLAYVRRNYLA